MRCPSCRNQLLQKSGNDTRVRIRGAPVFKADGSCEAQCFWCNKSVLLPLTLQKAEVRLVVPIPDRNG